VPSSDHRRSHQAQEQRALSPFVIAAAMVQVHHKNAGSRAKQAHEPSQCHQERPSSPQQSFQTQFCILNRHECLAIRATPETKQLGHPKEAQEIPKQLQLLKERSNRPNDAMCRYRQQWYLMSTILFKNSTQQSLLDTIHIKK